MTKPRSSFWPPPGPSRRAGASRITAVAAVRGLLSPDAPAGAFGEDDPPHGRGFEVADPAAADALSRSEDRQVLRRLLELVPGEQRAALTLSYLEGLSHEQIGRKLRLSGYSVHCAAIARSRAVHGRLTTPRPAAS